MQDGVLAEGCAQFIPGTLFGLGDQFGFLPQWLVRCAVLASGSSAMLCAWLFFRDWGRALAA